MNASQISENKSMRTRKCVILGIGEISANWHEIQVSAVNVNACGLAFHWDMSRVSFGHTKTCL